ncbi:CDP-diacylglycerol--serine O-phosphatidyltransferase [Thermodesulfobacteriota bacterium]
MTIRKVDFTSSEEKAATKSKKKSSSNKDASKYDTMKKGIYILPNLFTSSSLCLGFYAIVQVMHSNFNIAAMAIIGAAICDGLDGKVARLTGTSSQFGIEYDSLADLVSFGVAPGTMIYMWALKPYGKIGWLAAFLYVVCGALRLARFNVQVNTVEKSHFKGLPIPGAALMVASTILIHYELGGGGTIKKIIIPIMTYALAYLMVSNVKYQSFKDLDLIKKKPFHTLVFLVILLTVIVAAPELMIFILISLYVISGPIASVRSLVNKRV